MGTTDHRNTNVHGVVIVDKPKGPTSHDIVRDARRLFATRSVGHAGTLDPMATGVLVLLFGEATKLSGYLTAAAKSYFAEVTLGTATDSFDAEGTVLTTGPVPDFSDPVISAALTEERQRKQQVPPNFSAVKLAGRSAHERARKGETFELQPRSVDVFDIALERYEAPVASIRMTVSKGYYVRSFAHDLGQRLGVPSHLSALRRVASGDFSLADAISWPPNIRTPTLTVSEAARRGLSAATLTSEGVLRAQQGKPLSDADFLCPTPGTSAWFGPDRQLVAIGQQENDSYRVVRGFGRV